MTEQLLQYIWKHRLFEQKTYMSNTGSEVQIVHTGEQNNNAGPDFQYVKIRIGGTLWVGNCEVHLNASDWAKHKHQANEAYNNIVLHVVKNLDANVLDADGKLIPTIELKFDSGFEENYKQLMENAAWLACGNAPTMIERFYLAQWLTAVSIERLEQRSDEIGKHLNKSKQNWEEIFYQFLAKGFGFKVNAIAFEMLAKSLPQIILGKHKGNLMQLEALLFGQSGLLEKAENDAYVSNLRKEYAFLRSKYNLLAIEGQLWRFMRLRPLNFPTVRIAQFASLVNKSNGLFSKVLEVVEPEGYVELFRVTPSAYWDTHYSFGHVSPFRNKPLSDDSVHLLLVNTIVPFLIIYGKLKKMDAYRDRAITLLEYLKPEKNSIIEHWKEYGIEPRNMLESQALLQLRNEYCTKRRCLECSIGNKYMNFN